MQQQDDESVQDSTMTIIKVRTIPKLKSLELIQCYGFDVEKKQANQFLKHLTEQYPLSTYLLEHVKRIKAKDDKQSPFVECIICPITTTTTDDPLWDSFATQLPELVSNSAINSDRIKIFSVPKNCPQIEEHWREWNRDVWPLRGALLPKSLENQFQHELTDNEVQNATIHMKEVVELVKQSKRVSAVMVDPVTNSVIAKATDCSSLAFSPYYPNYIHVTDDSSICSSNPLDHPVMTCIQQVANREHEIMGRERNKIKVGDKRKTDQTSSSPAPYLCNGFDLYISHEPCCMCAMALVHSRIRRVFYGISLMDYKDFVTNREHWEPDQKRVIVGLGGLGSCYRVHEESSINHHFDVFKGLLEDDIRNAL